MNFSSTAPRSSFSLPGVLFSFTLHRQEKDESGCWTLRVEELRFSLENDTVFFDYNRILFTRHDSPPLALESAGELSRYVFCVANSHI